MKKMAHCLARLRNEHGFSFREAARAAGLTPSYLYKLEEGETFQSISVDTLVGLAHAYDVPIVHLLEEGGFVASAEAKLPELPQYVRLKYRLSNQGVRDMQMALDLVQHKYERGSS